MFTGLAVAENHRLDSLSCSTTGTCTPADTDRSSLHTDALVAGIAWAVALAGASVGIVLLVVVDARSASRGQATLQVGLSLAGVALAGTL